MRTTFAARELELVSRLSGLLLAPTNGHPQADWCAPVLHAARRLVRSGAAVLLLPGPSRPIYHGLGVDASTLQAHRDRAGAVDADWWLWARSGSAVARLRDAWEPEALRRSPYHREFLEPHVVRDVIGLAVLARGQPAGLFLIRFAGERPFAERDALLLAAVVPAFRAGMAFRHRRSRRERPLEVQGAVPTEGLRERFGLTPREVETALLLEEGRSNHEIATGLGVSLHTARHHVEAVLLKLNVKRRSAVAHRIRGSFVPARG